ncbi:MAG: methyltransferase domain-containing protein [Deltaproteobacteria bacterium]|nr:MAG: methyltransferase domain-containing protein [Deltaproteobacteria bacterium]
MAGKHPARRVVGGGDGRLATRSTIGCSARRGGHLLTGAEDRARSVRAYTPLVPGPSLPCPVCAHPVEALASLGSVPVHVGLLWRSPDEARSCPRGDLDLVLCPACGHVANAAFDPTRLDYTGDYDNALHHSPRFLRWEAGLVADLATGLAPGATVVEVGCGDGRFLAQLCRRADLRGVGFEPGFNPVRADAGLDGADVTVVDDFATPEAVAAHAPALVVARHVLEHLPAPGDFLAGMAALAPGVRVYLEVPDLDFALVRGALEDFMYEHCGYYTAVTLGAALRWAGFTVEKAESTFDGMFAAVTATTAGPAAGGTGGAGVPADPAVDPGELERIRSGIAAIEERIERLVAEFARRRRQGQRIVAWGGGARTVGLLNLVAEAALAIDLVVDINPRKQGTFVTGTGHAIRAPSVLSTDPPDAVYVVNPAYRDEITEMLTELGVAADVFSV